ncbi:metal ABC transporter ATP-binding protein [Alloiococcus sp. CFN-8]|uniref:metal ABC transporter ATP-binding protein n=1 Tax=Alloiococcus sp. CFN-8 TaxID=3416081 RepID=UPI003CF0FFB0
MITIDKLYFSYTGKSPYIIEDLNLTIPKGSYTSILGENGSSKTTLIKLILGVLKPLKGNISIKTKKIGYLPQKLEDFNSQFPLSVKELLSIHMKAKDLKDKSYIDKSLELVNMQSYKNSLIGNLSGGQQQKIFISRALMGDPELIIMDEPSTGVDVHSQKEIYSVIKELNLSKGITVISVEHNLSAALKYSTDILDLSGSHGLVTVKDYLKKFNEENKYQ